MRIQKNLILSVKNSENYIPEIFIKIGEFWTSAFHGFFIGFQRCNKSCRSGRVCFSFFSARRVGKGNRKRPCKRGRKNCPGNGRIISKTYSAPSTSRPNFAKFALKNQQEIIQFDENVLNCCDWSGAKECTSCRSQRMLKK